MNHNNDRYTKQIFEASVWMLRKAMTSNGVSCI